ncbi:MAG TPA: FtsX-like permease family protein, partial [Candidatus Sulfotelmatobacter sp.]
PGPMDDNSALWTRVTDEYFDVIGQPIIRGRGISPADTASSRRVAVVNETFVRKFFKNEDPIGRHFGKEPGKGGEYEIVGVVRDARYWVDNPDIPNAAYFFLPELQAEYSHEELGSLFLHDIVIRTKPGARVSEERVREAVASVDPNLPDVSVHTLREQVARQLTQPWLTARLTSFFGILSLILAAIGLYGVTAYNTSRRVNEVGVRMALGATRPSVLTLILRGAFILMAIGLLVGFPLSLAAVRILRTQLYGLPPYDPVVAAKAVVALGLSALSAALIPALRASSISPSEALRAE